MAPNAKQFQEWLVDNRACLSARLWCQGKSFAQAWRTCQNFLWMGWFVSTIGRKYRVREVEWLETLWVMAPDDSRAEKKAAIKICNYLRKHVKLPKRWQ